MRKVEIGLFILAFIAFAGLSAGFTGMAEILIMAVSSLTLLMFLFSFALINGIRFREIFKKESYKFIGTRRIIAGFLLGHSFSIVLTGSLFKWMFWVGAEEMLVVGLCYFLSINVLIIVISLVLKSVFYKRVITRTLIIGVIGISSYFLSYNDLINQRYPKDPEYAKALIKARENPLDAEAQLELQQERIRYLESRMGR
jgi:hypothetical protein